MRTTTAPLVTSANELMDVEEPVEESPTAAGVSTSPTSTKPGALQAAAPLLLCSGCHPDYEDCTTAADSDHTESTIRRTDQPSRCCVCLGALADIASAVFRENFLEPYRSRQDPDFADLDAKYVDTEIVLHPLMLLREKQLELRLGKRPGSNLRSRLDAALVNALSDARRTSGSLSRTGPSTSSQGGVLKVWLEFALNAGSAAEEELRRLEEAVWRKKEGGKNAGGSKKGKGKKSSWKDKKFKKGNATTEPAQLLEVARRPLTDADYAEYIPKIAAHEEMFGVSSLSSAPVSGSIGSSSCWSPGGGATGAAGTTGAASPPALLVPRLRDVVRLPVFFQGRYCKHSREVSQSPWFLPNEESMNNLVEKRGEQIRKTQWSVEELVALPFKSSLGPKGAVKFHAAGREDADVRMLGRGRPFCLQFDDLVALPGSWMGAALSAFGIVRQGAGVGKEREQEGGAGAPPAKRQRVEKVSESKQDINMNNVLHHEDGLVLVTGSGSLSGELSGSTAGESCIVSVQDFCRSSREFMAGLQLSAEQHTKIYSCVVYCDKVDKTKIGSFGGAPHPPIQVDQQTPIRVLHRRADLHRPKTVSRLQLKPAKALSGSGKGAGKGQGGNGNGRFFVCRLIASSGMYIKEFVHGDFGRTKPSLAELVGAGECDILQLDVENVIEDGESAEELF